ncbi:hypothetical protein [Sphingobium sp. DN12]|uniref:hypothetical protein n=1 Tax=Sphingobium sp. DN12 TaxID=3378073 RepID=UPI003DA2015A
MHLVARIDLIRLARHLTDTGGHPTLVKAIERAAAAGSIREDLRSALASLDQIVRIQEQSDAAPDGTPGWFDETTITGGLFVQAVVLYARATATTGDRRPLLGEAKLTVEQRAIHDEAMDYRNKAIAHFGRGEAFSDGPLVKEAVLLSLYNDKGRPKKQIGAYTTRAQHRIGFSARLATLIEVRIDEIGARYQALFDAADAALEEAVKADPDLGRALPGFEFNIDAFCTSPDTAARLQAQLDAGSVEDMDYTVQVPKP